MQWSSSHTVKSWAGHYRCSVDIRCNSLSCILYILNVYYSITCWRWSHSAKCKRYESFQSTKIMQSLYLLLWLNQIQLHKTSCGLALDSCKLLYIRHRGLQEIACYLPKSWTHEYALRSLVRFLKTITVITIHTFELYSSRSRGNDSASILLYEVTVERLKVHWKKYRGLFIRVEIFDRATGFFFTICL